MTSKQKCVTHAQATLPRLERKHLGSSQVRYATPTGFDWLDLLGMKYGAARVGIDGDGELMIRTEYATRERGNLYVQFNLATSEPDTEKDWDLLANLLGL